MVFNTWQVNYLGGGLELLDDPAALALLQVQHSLRYSLPMFFPFCILIDCYYVCLKGSNANVVLGLGGRRGVELTGWSALSATGLPIHQANVTLHFAMLGSMVFFWSFYTNLFLSTSLALFHLHLRFIPQDDRPCSMCLGKITLNSYGKWYELLFFGLCVQVSEEKVWIKCGRQA